MANFVVRRCATHPCADVAHQLSEVRQVGRVCSGRTGPHEENKLARIGSVEYGLRYVDFTDPHRSDHLRQHDAP